VRSVPPVAPAGAPPGPVARAPPEDGIEIRGAGGPLGAAGAELPDEPFEPLTPPFEGALLLAGGAAGATFEGVSS